MNPALLRRAVPALVGVVLLVVIACLPIKIAQGDDIAVTRVNQPVATIVKGVTVSEEFPAKGEAIGALGLFLTTYGSVTRGTFQVTVDAQRDGQWQTLASETIPTTVLSATAADSYTLRFSHPLAVTVDQPLRVAIQSSEESPASAITWWINPDFMPDGYVARINGKQQKGILCFAVTYQPRTGRVIQLLGPAWHRATIFLNVGWQIALFLGLVTVFLGVVACASLLVWMNGRSESSPH